MEALYARSLETGTRLSQTCPQTLKTYTLEDTRSLDYGSNKPYTEPSTLKLNSNSVQEETQRMLQLGFGVFGLRRACARQ